MNRRSRIPSYRFHKFSGQAVVTISGRDHYLGLHDTPESKHKYARLIEEWLACNRAPLAAGSATTPAKDITVSELTLAFWDHATKYYVNDKGEPTGEQQAIKAALPNNMTN